MRQVKLSNQSGVSILEVIIVLVVVTVLVTIAVGSFRSAGRNLDRQNIAREFKISLERARFDSVKRRASVCSDMSGVTVNADSFVLMIDMDNDGQLSDPEIRTVDLSARGDVSIVPNDVTLPLTIRFDQRGQAYLNDCDEASIPTADIPLLFFCNGVCTPDTANSENSNVIFVSPAGTIAMLYGGETMPAFGNANVSNVESNSNVNPLLAVWAPNSSGSPTPTPTATVSPSPTDTPPETPTPTVTPAPPACPTSAPWGYHPACTCLYPQTVRNNLQCK
jgi:type II secretory pathway pseudopilin PulG